MIENSEINNNEEEKEEEEEEDDIEVKFQVTNGSLEKLSKCFKNSGFRNSKTNLQSNPLCELTIEKEQTDCLKLKIKFLETRFIIIQVPIEVKIERVKRPYYIFFADLVETLLCKALFVYDCDIEVKMSDSNLMVSLKSEEDDDEIHVETQLVNKDKTDFSSFHSNSYVFLITDKSVKKFLDIISNLKDIKKENSIFFLEIVSKNRLVIRFKEDIFECQMTLNANLIQMSPHFKSKETFVYSATDVALFLTSFSSTINEVKLGFSEENVMTIERRLLKDEDYFTVKQQFYPIKLC